MGNQVGSLSEREAYVAFNLTDKIGSVKLSELVVASGSVAAAWEAYPQKVSRSGAELDWKRIYSSMAKPAFVFDGRNILDADALRKIGFEVTSIGKGKAE